MFDQTGQLKSTIAGHSGGLGQGTQPGSINGQFSVPTGLCIEGDMLYTADNGNHCVQKLTLVGRNPQPVSAYQHTTRNTCKYNNPSTAAKDRRFWGGKFSDGRFYVPVSLWPCCQARQLQQPP